MSASETPKLDLQQRRRAQQVYEECCENPEDFAYNYVAMESELAAARAQLDATCSPESFADLIRQRAELIAERYALLARCDNARQLERELARAIQERDALLRRYAHMHVAGPGDECRECGFDLRNPIHFRSAK